MLLVTHWCCFCWLSSTWVADKQKYPCKTRYHGSCFFLCTYCRLKSTSASELTNFITKVQKTESIPPHILAELHRWSSDSLTLKLQQEPSWASYAPAAFNFNPSKLFRKYLDRGHVRKLPEVGPRYGTSCIFQPITISSLRLTEAISLIVLNRIMKNVEVLF